MVEDLYGDWVLSGFWGRLLGSCYEIYVVLGKMDCCLLKIASDKKHPSKNTRSYRGGLVCAVVKCAIVIVAVFGMSISSVRICANRLMIDRVDAISLFLLHLSILTQY